MKCRALLLIDRNISSQNRISLTLLPMKMIVLQKSVTELLSSGGYMEYFLWEVNQNILQL